MTIEDIWSNFLQIRLCAVKSVKALAVTCWSAAKQTVFISK